MRQEFFEMNGIEMVRVSKASARKLYYDGYQISLYPCNANPEAIWFRRPIELSIDNSDIKEYENPFETSVNLFEYCNCQYNETGKYTKFFVEAQALQS